MSAPDAMVEFLRSELADLEAGIEADERALDLGEETANLREAIAEGRALQARVRRVLDRVEEVYPWLREDPEDLP